MNTFRSHRAPVHSLGFGTLNGFVASIEFLRATAFHNVAVLEEALYLRSSCRARICTNYPPCLMESRRRQTVS